MSIRKTPKDSETLGMLIGLAVPLSLKEWQPSCIPCRKDKCRCEGNPESTSKYPCQKCTNNRIMQYCIPYWRKSTGNPYPAPKLPYQRKRAKISCLHCRTNHRKCSEEPTCSQCVNDGTFCVHPSAQNLAEPSLQTSTDLNILRT